MTNEFFSTFAKERDGGRMTNEEAIQVLTERRITLGHDFGWDTSMLLAFEKAIAALLNQPESVKPEIGNSGGGLTGWYVCGKCSTPINPNVNYCPECGVKILWPEDEK